MLHYGIRELVSHQVFCNVVLAHVGQSGQHQASWKRKCTVPKQDLFEDAARTGSV